jgi:hypothetical protein
MFVYLCYTMLVEVNIIMIDLHFVFFVYVLFFCENIKSYIMTSGVPIIGNID